MHKIAEIAFGEELEVIDSYFDSTDVEVKNWPIYYYYVDKKNNTVRDLSNIVDEVNRYGGRDESRQESNSYTDKINEVYNDVKNDINKKRTKYKIKKYYKTALNKIDKTAGKSINNGRKAVSDILEKASKKIGKTARKSTNQETVSNILEKASKKIRPKNALTKKVEKWLK